MNIKIEDDEIIEAWGQIKKCLENKVELELSVFIIESIILETIEKKSLKQ